MKRILRKIRTWIWYQVNFRRDALARIANLDQRLAALESSAGSKPKAMTISTGRQ